MGARWTLIASGERKTDGNPHAKTSDEAVSAARDRVDALANVFFEFVATHRGVSAESVRALEARVVHGKDAVSIGLADEVSSLDQMLASVASQAPDKGIEGPMDEEKMRASLKAVLEDEKSDEKAKARARRMLAAMDEDAEAEEEAKKAKAEEEQAKKAKAEADKAEEEARAAAAAKAQEEEDAKATALRAMRELHAFRVEREAEKEAAERKELLASRPDFDEKTAAFLSKLPIAQVRDAVRDFPRGPARSPSLSAATAVVPSTRGASHGSPEASAEAHELDIQMGLARATQAIRHDGTRLVLGVMTPAEAKAYQAEKEKAQSGQSAR